MSPESDFALFLGRFHPVLVHLPIGFILLLALLELMARLAPFRGANAGAGYILALSVPATIVAAVCGWLLADEGGYEASLLQWHRWLGVATAAACLLMTALYLVNLKRQYRLTLGVTVVLLAAASHFGGSLTHGSDYLVRHAPDPIRKWLGNSPAAAEVASSDAEVDVLQKPAFAGVVQPVLKKYCVGCHGPEKAKDDLRLDSFEALKKGSEHGPVVVPGDTAGSPLLRRLKLPLDHDDHMPPEGKPQPSADEIAVLEWWVAAGANDRKLGELNPPEKILNALRPRGSAVASAPKSVAPKPLKEVMPTVEKLVDDFGIAVGPLSQTEAWLQANASIAGTNFGDAQLAAFAPLAPNLRWLDLAGTAVTDAGLAPLGRMPNLARLHLERTKVTDAGLRQLSGLSELEYLNLHSTAVTDAGLESIRSLPKLRQLYLWQSKVTPAAAKAMAEAREDKEQIRRWEEEIEQLKARIRGQQLAVDLGVAVASAAPATNSAPINQQCPVSGKPVDLAKRLVYEGRIVAFCCDNCKGKFEKDPKPFLEPLGLKPAATGSSPAK